MYFEVPVDDNGPQPKESSMFRTVRWLPLLPLFALTPLLLFACEGDLTTSPQSSFALLKFCNLRAGPNNTATEITLDIGNPSVRISGEQRNLRAHGRARLSDHPGG